MLDILMIKAKQWLNYIIYCSKFKKKRDMEANISVVGLTLNEKRCDPGV